MDRKDVVVIMGYNNVRIYDVARIRSKVNDHFHASLLLCQPNIGHQDREAADFVLDISLLDIEGSLEKLEIWRKENNKHFIGILPFSDRGVPIGARAAKKYGLFYDCPERAASCLDKRLFRHYEKDEKNLPIWYKTPFSTVVHSQVEAINVIKEQNRRMFIKPTSEGNSRGCIDLKTPGAIFSHWPILEPYVKEGLLMEEYITGHQYSFNGVGDFFWMSEKETTDDSYFRGEIQDILPAPVDDFTKDRLIEGGKIISKISGSFGGAVHNELFLLPNQDIMAVEPNRRPAGGKIWDLAELAFEGFDPWENWISIAIGRKVKNADFKMKNHVGIRLILAKNPGVIKGISFGLVEKIECSNASIEKISISKSHGDTVTNDPADNSGFLGYIIVKDKDPAVVKKLLKDAAENVRKSIVIQ